ncbi:MAG: ABC transporter permease [Rhodovulum sp.]|nr:ABC transporter permease [Rhodovulum sp.]
MSHQPSSPPAVTGPPVGSTPARSLLARLGEPRVLSWLSVVIVLAGWELAVIALALNPIYLPRPSRIVVALFEMFRTGGLTSDLIATLSRIFGGFFLALGLGVALGVWMATSERVRAVADTFIAALYPLPKVTLIPLLIIWLGTGGPFMLTISMLGAFFPIVINTVLGIGQCDQGLVLAARDLGASRRQIIRMVLLPSAIPSIFAGIRLGLGVSIILVVAAEMVVGKVGLGARLYLAGQVLETEQVFAVLIVLATLGIVVTKAQDMIDVRLGHWRVN